MRRVGDGCPGCFGLGDDLVDLGAGGNDVPVGIGTMAIASTSTSVRA